MCIVLFFFFNDTATTEIYTLSLHDALPIFGGAMERRRHGKARRAGDRQAHVVAALAGTHAARSRRDAPATPPDPAPRRDRKSTRLNSSHANISYAVFCLKKKKHHQTSSALA